MNWRELKSVVHFVLHRMETYLLFQPGCRSIYSKRMLTVIANPNVSPANGHHDGI